MNGNSSWALTTPETAKENLDTGRPQRGVLCLRSTALVNGRCGVYVSLAAVVAAFPFSL